MHLHTLTYLNTAQCYIIGQEKVFPFVSKKTCLRRGPDVTDENSKIPYYTKRMSLLLISQIRKRERRKKSHTGSRSSLYLCITSSRCPCHLYVILTMRQSKGKLFVQMSIVLMTTYKILDLVQTPQRRTWHCHLPPACFCNLRQLLGDPLRGRLCKELEQTILRWPFSWCIAEFSPTFCLLSLSILASKYSCPPFKNHNIKSPFECSFNLFPRLKPDPKYPTV